MENRRGTKVSVALVVFVSPPVLPKKSKMIQQFNSNWFKLEPLMN
jgi:hypothetical protein